MSSVESKRPISVRQLFIVTAAMELGAGLTLLAAPALVISVLFGPTVDVYPAAGILRLTGAALLALGAACWWARHDERSPAARALLGAMLIYNAAVVALGIIGSLGPLGPLQSVAVVLHGAQAILCAWLVADPAPVRSPPSAER